MKYDLSELTTGELKRFIIDANKLLQKREFEERKEREQTSRMILTVGDIVTVTGNRFSGEIWEVLKLNPKKVQCKRENGETWNIPYSHIIID